MQWNGLRVKGARCFCLSVCLSFPPAGHLCLSFLTLWCQREGAEAGERADLFSFGLCLEMALHSAIQALSSLRTFLASSDTFTRKIWKLHCGLVDGFSLPGHLLPAQPPEVQPVHALGGSLSRPSVVFTDRRPHHLPWLCLPLLCYPPLAQGRHTSLARTKRSVQALPNPPNSSPAVDFPHCLVGTTHSAGGPVTSEWTRSALGVLLGASLCLSWGLSAERLAPNTPVHKSIFPLGFLGLHQFLRPSNQLPVIPLWYFANVTARWCALQLTHVCMSEMYLR